MNYIANRLPKGFKIVVCQSDIEKPVSRKEVQEKEKQQAALQVLERKRVSRNLNPDSESWSLKATKTLQTISGTEHMRRLQEEIRLHFARENKPVKGGLHNFDFSSIRRKLSTGDYIGQSAFLRDIEVYWQFGNSFDPESNVGVLSQTLHDVFDDLYLNDKELSELHLPKIESLIYLSSRDQKILDRGSRKKNLNKGLERKVVKRRKRDQNKFSDIDTLKESEEIAERESDSGSQNQNRNTPNRKNSTSRNETKRKNVAIIPVKPLTGKQTFETGKNLSTRSDQNPSIFNLKRMAINQPESHAEKCERLKLDLTEFLQIASEEEMRNFSHILKKANPSLEFNLEIDFVIEELPEDVLQEIRSFISRKIIVNNYKFRMGGVGIQTMQSDKPNSTDPDPEVGFQKKIEDNRNSREHAGSSKSSFFTGR